MSIEYRVIRSDKWGPRESLPNAEVLHHEVLDMRARLAASFIERWGMVAAEPDGEDSAGRQQMKLMDPADLVWRACSVVDSLYIEFKDRNWIIELPTFAEMDAEIAKREGQKAPEEEPAL